MSPQHLADPREVSLPVAAAPPTRRTFLRAAGVTAGAAVLGALPACAAGTASVAAQTAAAPAVVAATPGARRRYALVGTGDRGSSMWGKDVVTEYGDLLEFVGLCDLNPKRVEAAKKLIGVTCPTFTDFDKMCDQAKPELLAITTIDAFHAGYIVKALDRGIDVLTEKPMVIDDTQCRAVLAAEKRNHRNITVTFNARYAPKHRQIKELLLTGAIGKVLSVDFNWYLDTSHGADYFRRWHRLRACSGSLWCHKATHHFDLANWWLDAEPVDVIARGELRFYGKNGPYRAPHCRDCPHRQECKFYYDITKSARYQALYIDCEDVDHYYRDGCVFREDIDIFDQMTALVRYNTGVTMTYSLNAFLPIEGYRIAFNGDRGRLEIRDFDRQPWKVEEESEIILSRQFAGYEKFPTAKGEGAHAGGDAVLKDVIFRQAAVPAHMRLPTSRAGAMSCLIGIAARRSIDERRTVTIKELLGE